eukprot:TRINITY_DN10757_c0_g2_i1.p1 TRINITY_DN10757_c0_g2~~TRINITY_DN10757_c0_g2_i1.p1  ORF type:complete len:158 (-),score=16.97 TRINITY_DN10757_c0_g2_i1:120-527(-)
MFGSIVNSFCRSSKAVWGRAKRGLFHGRSIVYGNNVSFSNKKTRTRWMPNVQPKYLYSHLLNLNIKFHITTHALRCIEKAGNLDRYLLYTKAKDIDSEIGLKIRKKLKDAYRLQTGEKFDRLVIPRLDHLRSTKD